jgi:hypothetical protein
MNLLSILILALAFIIVLASIFNESFQKLIFQNTQGQAQFGKFTVKGVTFLVIVLALVACAVFLETNKPAKKYTMNDAVEFLKKESGDSFRIVFDEKSQMLVFLNNQLVARENPEKKITFRKGAKAKDYDLLIDRAVMGNFSLNIDQEQLKKNEPTYYQNEPYRFNDKNFWFKLVRLKTKKDKSTKKKLAYYTFTFGEGESVEEIKWTSKKITIPKSDNGKLSNGIQFISDNNWEKSYVLSIGAGKFGGKERIHIDLIQSELAIVDVAD